MIRKFFNWKFVLACLPLSALGTVVLAPVTFEEIAGKAGVHFKSNSSPTPLKHTPEAMLAGVAIFDYDGDGYPDFYFVNGAGMPSLVKDGPQYKNRLFQQQRQSHLHRRHRQGRSGRRRVRHGRGGGRLRQRRAAGPVRGRTSTGTSCSTTTATALSPM